MESTYPKFFLILSITFSILMSSSVAHLVMGQSANTTSVDSKNNTRRIINLIDNTVTVVDKTTNETISVTPYEGGNNTTNNTTKNGTFPVIIQNTTNNTTKNGTFPVIIQNTTTNTNLTEKFNALSK